jgi:glutamyl-Q tRNA(Asp) synthetase
MPLQSATRFAPSPTGLLHLGHAYSALLAYRWAQENQARFVLRVEDIDPARCRGAFTNALYEDLSWLGLRWETPVRLQSQHMADYQAALDNLHAQELLYPCFCTRSDIAAEIARAGNAPHAHEYQRYPGLCKHLSKAEQAVRMAQHTASGQGFAQNYAWRLHTDRALARTGALSWSCATHGLVDAKPELLGDVVLARKDTPTSYYLAATWDDALQNITHVIRGEDLYNATHMQRLLQALLGLPTPRYQHHALLTDAEGKRYAKRDKALTLQALRAQGVGPQEIYERVGLPSLI